MTTPLPGSVQYWREMAERYEAALRKMKHEPQQLTNTTMNGPCLEERLIDEWVCVHCGCYGEPTADKIEHADDCEYVMIEQLLSPTDVRKHCASCNMPASSGTLFVDGDALKCGNCLRSERDAWRREYDKARADENAENANYQDAYRRAVDFMHERDTATARVRDLEAERDAAVKTCEAAKNERDALRLRLERMVINEPIAEDAPCFNCEGAPFHSDDCDYRPRKIVADNELRALLLETMHMLLYFDAHMNERIEVAKKVATAICHEWPPYPDACPDGECECKKGEDCDCECHAAADNAGDDEKRGDNG